MIESPRPIVRPKDDVWNYCERLAEEHNTTPLQVLKDLLYIGEEVAKIEEKGEPGTVACVMGDKKIEIRVFGVSGNGR